jgi:hypothetical protein
MAIDPITQSYLLYKGAQKYGKKYGHTKLGGAINKGDDWAHNNLFSNLPGYHGGDRGKSATGNDSYDVAYEQAYQEWKAAQPITANRSREAYNATPEFRLFTEQQGKADKSAKEEERGEKHREDIDKFYELMMDPKWMDSPEAQAIKESVMGTRSMGLSDRGFEGGLAESAVARAGYDAQLGEMARRQGLGLQAKTVGLQDTQGLERLRESQYQYDVSSYDKAHGNQVAGKQAMGATIGGGLGLIAGGLAGSVVPGAGTVAGAGLGASFGSQIGGSIGGSSAPAYRPPRRGGGGRTPSSGRNY